MAQPAAPPTAFLSPELLRDPYPLYHQLRKTSPVLRLPVGAADGPGVWLLTRHADVQAALRDPRMSVDRRRAAVVRESRDLLPPRLLGEEGGLRSMLVMDPPDHTRVRGLVAKAFTPRRVARLHGRIEALVEALLDEAEQDARASPDGAWDVMEALAAPLPAIVIAELLGVPPEDHRRFKQWSNDVIATLAGGPGQVPRDLERAVGVILDYLARVIAARRAAPRDDLISAMIQAQEQRDALSDAELLATSNLLLLAGHETTTNLIGNGLLALLRHPEAREALLADAGLLGPAIEEMLRWDSPVQATGRVAREELELGGVRLAEGALVITGIGAANRDPEVFEEPDRFEVTRESRHLSFGLGPHFCLGAPLARLEGELAFRALLARFPRLELVDRDPPRRPNFFLRGLASLRVRSG